MSLPADKKLLTIGEASAYLDISADTLRRLEAKGRIEPKRGTYNERLYSLDDVLLIRGIIRKTPSSQKTYSIKEAANLLNISSQTIRRWEKEGRIKTKRTSGGHRYFTYKDIQEIRNIKLQPKTRQEIQIPPKEIVRVIGEPLPSAPQEAFVSNPPFSLFDFKLISFVLVSSLLIFIASYPSNIEHLIKKMAGIPIPEEELVSIPEGDWLSVLSAQGGVYEGDVGITGDVDIVGNLNVSLTTTTKDLVVSYSASMYSLSVTSGLVVSGNEIINSSGKIPALNGSYFADLNGENISNVDAHHLGGVAASSFLRSNEVDTAEAVINFTASPGSTDVNGGPVYINPAASTSDYTLFGIALGGSQRFKVDAEGDVSIAGNTTVDGTIYGSFSGTINLGFTQGSVIFQGSSGFAEDNAQFFWDETNNKLGLGTTSPLSLLHIATNTTTLTGKSALIIDQLETEDIFTASASGTPKFVIDSSGNVGIGTTLPDAPLEVSGRISQIDLGDSNYLGYKAGYVDDLTSNKNIGIGYYSLSSNTSGYVNTAIGYAALYTNISGYANTAIGWDTLFRNTGDKNTAIGASSLRENTTGFSNTAIGNQAMNENTEGYANIAIGNAAFYTNTLGDENVALGYAALYKNTTGSFNSVVGVNALRENQTGSENTAVGYQAGFGVSANSYSNNALFGFKAGYALTTGSSNVLLGYQAGDNLTSGGTNIVIGYDIDAPLATSTQTLNIGNLIFATGLDGIGTTISSGNVGIGTTNPDSLLTLYSTASETKATIESNNADGDALLVFENTGVQAWTIGQDDGDSDKFKISKIEGFTDPVMTLDTSGYVGIGTANPGATLAVENSTNPTIRIGEGGVTNRLIDIKVDTTNSVAYIDSSFYSGGAFPLVFKIGSGEKVRIDTNGRVGIGRTPSTANLLEVEGTASKTAAGDWLANSDIRIKTDVQDLSNALDIIDSLRPVKFKYTDEYMAAHPSLEDRYYYNFIAQEFQEVFPDSVQDSGENGYLQLDAYNVRPYLVAAMQELNTKVKALELGSESNPDNDNEAENLESEEENEPEDETVNGLISRMDILETEMLLLQSSFDLASPTEATDSSFLTSLTVLGDSVLGDTVINGRLDIGILSFDNLTGSIDAIGPLKLQPLALAPIEFVGGAIEMDQEGNLDIKKGVVKGNEKIREAAEILPNQTSIVIQKEWETPPVSILVTPSYNAQGWVTDITNSGFTINVDKSPTITEKLYWWAIW
ncbi:MerR family transcriptional regulator [Patescibacteria group bacterium]|nr:MerR family transcriptional regulator [Patescibacteria group bacterium]MBU0777241.1 MerR family transcriptional regulator [Patescibacteria group bacterium]MBU0845936.1 MerR family transcriptional regulator [Patescibacteria group bacterium]MBU0922964.1 MerR family transcriptional regulator [Patescibacteria group bacterium]MBU1066186.1 MerR family transcriptional regulator [Patescibacteria group bacterium]